MESFGAKVFAQNRVQHRSVEQLVVVPKTVFSRQSFAVTRNQVFDVSVLQTIKQLVDAPRVFTATKISRVDRMLQCTVEQTTHVPVPLVPQMMEQLVVAPMFSISTQGPAMGCRAIVGLPNFKDLPRTVFRCLCWAEC